MHLPGAGGDPLPEGALEDKEDAGVWKRGAQRHTVALFTLASANTVEVKSSVVKPSGVYSRDKGLLESS